MTRPRSLKPTLRRSPGAQARSMNGATNGLQTRSIANAMDDGDRSRCGRSDRRAVRAANPDALWLGQRLSSCRRRSPERSLVRSRAALGGCARIRPRRASCSGASCRKPGIDGIGGGRWRRGTCCRRGRIVYRGEQVRRSFVRQWLTSRTRPRARHGRARARAHYAAHARYMQRARHRTRVTDAPTGASRARARARTTPSRTRARVHRARAAERARTPVTDAATRARHGRAYPYGARAPLDAPRTPVTDARARAGAPQARACALRTRHVQPVTRVTDARARARARPRARHGRVTGRVTDACASRARHGRPPRARARAPDARHVRPSRARARAR